MDSASLTALANPVKDSMEIFCKNYCLQFFLNSSDCVQIFANLPDEKKNNLSMALVQIHSEVDLILFKEI